MTTNEQTVADYIREVGWSTLNPEWVVWILKHIEYSNRNGTKLNPEWLRADLVVWYIGLQERPDDPPMGGFDAFKPGQDPLGYPWCPLGPLFTPASAPLGP